MLDIPGPVLEFMRDERSYHGDSEVDEVRGDGDCLRNCCVPRRRLDYCSILLQALREAIIVNRLDAVILTNLSNATRIDWVDQGLKANIDVDPPGGAHPPYLSHHTKLLFSVVTHAGIIPEPASNLAERRSRFVER